MTNYRFTENKTISLFPSFVVKEKKAARQKVLAAIWDRRKIIYRRYKEKLLSQLHQRTTERDGR